MPTNDERDDKRPRVITVEGVPVAETPAGTKEPAEYAERAAKRAAGETATYAKILTRKYPQFRGQVAQFAPTADGVLRFLCAGKELLITTRDLSQANRPRRPHA